MSRPFLKKVFSGKDVSTRYQTSSFVCAGALAASDSFERTRSTAAA